MPANTSSARRKQRLRPVPTWRERVEVNHMARDSDMNRANQEAANISVLAEGDTWRRGWEDWGPGTGEGKEGKSLLWKHIIKKLLSFSLCLFSPTAPLPWNHLFRNTISASQPSIDDPVYKIISKLISTAFETLTRIFFSLTLGQPVTFRVPPPAWNDLLSLFTWSMPQASSKARLRWHLPFEAVPVTFPLFHPSTLLPTARQHPA